jgi:hypothetical protein
MKLSSQLIVSSSRIFSCGEAASTNDACAYLNPNYPRFGDTFLCERHTFESARVCAALLTVGLVELACAETKIPPAIIQRVPVFVIYFQTRKRMTYDLMVHQHCFLLTFEHHLPLDVLYVAAFVTARSPKELVESFVVAIIHDGVFAAR